MVLSVDLNEPVAGSQQSEETAAPRELQHGYPAAENAIGSSASPIDVDAVDDEVILLPSSALFLEARNCARRRPDTVVINENMQTVAARSVKDLSLSNLPLNLCFRFFLNWKYRQKLT
ncbi:hypothetical protein AXF42_Ash006578 [Apostasia shenzhenica]|uniref:Uncharacterized protein n=1 Tax=Apostasia shenzhenica TaxID=1088818 RepID=A0A2I0AZG0_9ASPA|nr:hypothetical protein AXF42_Ash006578 [Apostasia shenzhenica]